MADLGRAPAGRPMRLVWMVVALVVVGGFLAWLGVASSPTTVAVVEANDENDNNDDPAGANGLVVVERDTLAESLPRFENQQVRVRGVPATGQLGPNIFWGELGDMGRQRPVLVRLDEEMAGTVDIEAGREYTITGQVLQVTEALVEEWGEAGEFRGEGEQMQATFADYYIQARLVRPTVGARGQPGG